MLKKILVPLDDSDFTDTAIRMAAYISTRGKSEGLEPAVVSGMGIVDLDQLPKGRFASMVPRDAIIEEANQAVSGIVDKFRSVLSEEAVAPANVETRTFSGSPFAEVIRESVFADLIVMGEKCSFPPVLHDYDTLHHLYHESSRPIVLTGKKFSPVRTVVFAMDGTAPSSRMLYTYLHLNPFPQANVVLTYSRHEEMEYGLSSFFQRIGETLENYGHKVTVAPVDGASDGAFEQEVVELVKKKGAEMLAIGIHKDQVFHRLTDPFQIRDNFAMRLLRGMDGALFMVN